MENKRSKRTILYGITAVFGILALLLLLILLFFFSRQERGLKFWRPNNAVIIADGGEAVDVDFPALNSDPARYQNQFIRVSGDYQRPPLLSCADPVGPAPRWSLINGDLSLEAIRFEGVLRLVPDGTAMVVEGIWRRYDGPLGCDKGNRAVAWYLETIRIISPNPLTNFDGTAVYPNNPDGNTPIITSTPIAGQTVPPNVTITPTPTGNATTPTLPAGTPTAGSTVPPAEMTETAVATMTGMPTAIPTSTGLPIGTSTVAPTATPTVTDGSPTLTATPSSTPIPLSTSTPAPPGPTSTPGDYPVPSPTVVPTPY